MTLPGRPEITPWLGVSGRLSFRKIRPSWLLVLGTLVWLGTAGPFAEARVTLNANLSVQETYTDNLLFTAQNKEDDFGTFISPTLTLGYESRDVVLRGTYGGVAQFFVNNPDQNVYAQNTNFFIDLPGLTRRYRGLEVELIWSFNFTPQLDAFSFAGEPGQRPLIPETARSNTTPTGASGTDVGGLTGISPTIAQNLNNQGIVNQRSDVFQNVAGFTLTYAYTPRLSPSLSYRNRLQKFVSGGFQDSLSHDVNLGLAYRWSRRTSTRVNYGINIVNFMGSGGEEANDFQTHNLDAGVTQQLQPTLALDASAGATLIERKGEESTTRFNGSLRLEKAYTQGTFSVRLDQFIGTGGGLAAQATLVQNFVGTIEHNFTRHLSAYLLGGVAKNTSLESDDIDLLTFQAVTGARVRLLSWLDGNVTYSYVAQESSGSLGEDAQRQTVFFGLTAFMTPWTLMQ